MAAAKPPRRFGRLLIEAVAIVAIVTAAWGFIYGPFLETCCGFADVVVLGILWSASVVGGFLTGSGANPGRGAVLLGLIIEALTVWAIIRARARKMHWRS